MTMDFSNDGFFKSYLTALTDIQLDALVDWQSARLADSSVPDLEQIASDAINKKRLIYQERQRRTLTGRQLND